MSLFDLQDVCIAIGSIATLDLPMVVDLIGIYGLKGPYSTLTMTNWFLQALSVIPRGSWGDVARGFYHDPLGRASAASLLSHKELPPPPPPLLRRKIVSGQFDEGNPSAQISSSLLVQDDKGVSNPVVDLIGVNYRNLPIYRLPDMIFLFFRCLAVGRDPDPNSEKDQKLWLEPPRRCRAWRRPTARMNARGTCALAAHGRAPPRANCRARPTALHTGCALLEWVAALLCAMDGRSLAHRRPPCAMDAARLRRPLWSRSARYCAAAGRCVGARRCARWALVACWTRDARAVLRPSMRFAPRAIFRWRRPPAGRRSGEFPAMS
ncbi:hypothetical protein F511_09290 [Dorcoceras hygrometricum]|uniref:DNA-directed RNA polymerase V subunit 1 n=1 Tax=Dorcoceras hygrometricum TaxID=472368 RepID=A0A2Z7DI11_9LAMI|nr:hypothetical protein F511_09290 [Dorcoceras hygrometricum]